MTIPPNEPLTVLFVEDYPPGLMVGTLMIEHLGYPVLTASCGQQAIDHVLAATEPFLAILMDVNMGDMDGFQAAKAIRLLDQEKGVRNTIIVVTAHALSGDRQHCIDAGMDDYMSKPLYPAILERTLAALAKTRRNG